MCLCLLSKLVIPSFLFTLIVYFIHFKRKACVSAKEKGIGGGSVVPTDSPILQMNKGRSDVAGDDNVGW